MNSGGTWNAAGMPIDLNSGPQIISHDVVEDQHEGVTDQQLHQHVAAIDPADEHALEDRARRSPSPARAAQHGQRVAAGELIDVIAK